MQQICSLSLVLGRGQEGVKCDFDKGQGVLKSEYSENQMFMPNESQGTVLKADLESQGHERISL